MSPRTGRRTFTVFGYRANGQGQRALWGIPVKWEARARRCRIRYRPDRVMVSSDSRRMGVARLDAEELRVGVDEIVAHFHELEDPRSTVNQRHPLVSVVVIAVMAVLAGANRPTAIAEWAL